MPKYEYDCSSCGSFSDFRPMADYERPATCPSCNVGGTTRFLERSSNFDAFPRGCARRHGQCESVLGKHRPWRGLWMLRQSENST